MAVADCSGQAWVQGFDDVGLAVFGIPADDLIELKVIHIPNCMPRSY